VPTDCYYRTRNQCGGQFEGETPPAGWLPVTCDGCEKQLGHACPSCSLTEGCVEECDPPCPECQPIPPPTPPSPDAARRQEQMRRALEGGGSPPTPSKYPDYSGGKWPPAWPPPPKGDEGT